MRGLFITFTVAMSLIFSMTTSWAIDPTPITIPHQFTGGTKAMASDVNANFSAVRNGINTNRLAVYDVEGSVLSLESTDTYLGNQILEKQDLVVGSCPIGQSIRVINSDGTVECEVDDGGGGGSGDITDVLTTAPLAGGADSGAVTLSLINEGITSAHLGSNSVGTSEIQDGSIAAADIASNAVGTGHIANGAVSTAKIAADAVTASQIVSGAVGSDEILDGSIVSGDVDSTSLQLRVTGTCPTGSAVLVGLRHDLPNLGVLLGAARFDNAEAFDDAGLGHLAFQRQ